MCDLIDREKLYNYLNDWAFGIAPDERHEGTERLIRQVKYETIQECMSAVEDLPSAEIALNLHQTIKNDASDLISRQALLRSYQKEICYGVECHLCPFLDKDTTCLLDNWLTEQPSAESSAKMEGEYEI